MADKAKPPPKPPSWWQMIRDLIPDARGLPELPPGPPNAFSIPDILRGATGFGDQGPAGPTWTNAGALAAAALPFAPGLKSLKALATGEQLAAGTNQALDLSAVKGIRAYHGSPHDFEKFALEKAGTTTDTGQLGRALYFSTDPNVAATSPHRYEVNIDVRNPLTVQFPKWTANKKELVTKALGISPESSAVEIAAAAKAKGFDSVVLDYSPVQYKHKEVAAFDENMIDLLRKYGWLPPVAGLGYLSQVGQPQRPETR